jgi:hypothetical protein
MTMQDWAVRWGIPQEAIAELMGAIPITLKVSTAPSEDAVKRGLRLAAPQYGALLWRNNVGVMFEDRRVVRFGLANDSEAVNRRIKSADLIGISATGRFVSIEVKTPGWRYSGTEREKAQLLWNNLVSSRGGVAGFATSVLDLPRILSDV